jgi:hypothetical protein
LDKAAHWKVRKTRRQRHLLLNNNGKSAGDADFQAHAQTGWEWASGFPSDVKDDDQAAPYLCIAHRQGAQLEESL